MLEERYRENVQRLLNELDCCVVLPERWSPNYFREQGTMPTCYGDRRRFVRHVCRSRTVLRTESTLSAIPRAEEFHIVILRDLSRTGVGFLHAAQLFPEEQCELWLPTRITEVVVSNCRRLGSRCYLIGARFAETGSENGNSQAN